MTEQQLKYSQIHTAVIYYALKQLMRNSGVIKALKADYVFYANVLSAVKFFDDLEKSND